MFGSLRSKFQTMQEGISASIRALSMNENSKSTKSVNVRDVNYGAGADILHHYQLQWNELHQLAEENAGKAQEVDMLIFSIYEKLQHEWNNITCLNSTLAYIPKINNVIQEVMDQIGNLQEMFEEVESTLYRLEDLHEMLDLQNRELDHKFQLALYREKKLTELNNFQTKLANEHIEKVSKHELKQQKKLKERCETFEEAFKEDLEEYKTTGSIPKLPISPQGPSLDEIVLDTDTKIFDEFLEN